MTLPPERRLQAAATWEITLLPLEGGVPISRPPQLQGPGQDAPRFELWGRPSIDPELRTYFCQARRFRQRKVGKELIARVRTIENRVNYLEPTHVGCSARQGGVHVCHANQGRHLNTRIKRFATASTTDAAAAPLLDFWVARLPSASTMAESSGNNQLTRCASPGSSQTP